MSLKLLWQALTVIVVLLVCKEARRRRVSNSIYCASV